MDAIEMINFVDSISSEMMEILSIKSKEDLENCLNKLRGELKSHEDCEELKEFISKSNDLLSILEGGHYNDNVKKESFLHIVSLVSAERSKIIEKYTLCSEPD